MKIINVNSIYFSATGTTKKIVDTISDACGRCIAICPQKARRFGGILYSIVNRKFIKNFITPLSPELFYNFNNKI